MSVRAGNCVSTVVWPARYDKCIAVAGVDSADRKWKGSCSGSAVDISAPAQNVYRASAITHDVGQGEGTSYAVALTAGGATVGEAPRTVRNAMATSTPPDRHRIAVPPPTSTRNPRRPPPSTTDRQPMS